MHYTIQQQLDTHFDHLDADSDYVILNNLEVDFNQLTLDDVIALEEMKNR